MYTYFIVLPFMKFLLKFSFSLSLCTCHIKLYVKNIEEMIKYITIVNMGGNEKSK